LTILLDTNILIDVLSNRRGRPQLLKQLASQKHSLACCSTGIAGLYAGLRAEHRPDAEELISDLLFVPVTVEAAKLAGMFKHRYARQGIALSVMDTTIAAVAVTHDLTLLTDNAKDFPMPEIKLYPLPQN
jgi:predicted nucleic acid-binding protein